MSERDDLMNEISELCGIPEYATGRGKSVLGDFVDALALAQGFAPQDYPNKYRRIEAVIDSLGGTYDEAIHTSEYRGRTGGGTITNPGLLYIRDLLRREMGPQAVRRVVERLEPYSIVDARVRRTALVLSRQGQGAFRSVLLGAYEGACAITRWDAWPGLDAAHIVPFRGPETNAVYNGLLLRSDLHALFDLGLLCISPEDYSVQVHESLSQTSVWECQGIQLYLPAEQDSWPDPDLLMWHVDNVFQG